MKKNSKAILYGLLGLSIIVFIILLLIKPSTIVSFDDIDIPRTHSIKNETDVDFLKPMLSVALNEASIDTLYVTIQTIPEKTIKKASSRDGIELGGLLISGPPGSKQYVIQLSDDLSSIRGFIEVIAHEVIHIQQYESGKLKILRDGNGELTGEVEWQGWNYDIFKVKYEDRPWEQDAYEKDKKLTRKMIKRLYIEND